MSKPYKISKGSRSGFLANCFWGGLGRRGQKNTHVLEKSCVLALPPAAATTTTTTTTTDLETLWSPIGQPCGKPSELDTSTVLLLPSPRAESSEAAKLNMYQVLGKCLGARYKLRFAMAAARPKSTEDSQNSTRILAHNRSAILNLWFLS